MKYSAVMAFIVGWMFVVYFPLAHMVWGVDGMMNGVWNANGEHQVDRLRRRNGRAHVVRLVGARSLLSFSASARASDLVHSSRTASF